jgi:hypothetical protein
VILTQSLTGAYDLDFTLLARYYASYPLDKVPSIYVDLQLPPLNTNETIQPSLRLRLKSYTDDAEGLLKINRQDLMNTQDSNVQLSHTLHQLPHLYHFNMSKHSHSSSKPELNDRIVIHIYA